MIEAQDQSQQELIEEAPKGDAAPWLAMIGDAEKRFKDWQSKCDNIDKQYADMTRLANTTRDRQFQIFWANIEVMKPSIYARVPVPVVTPRFRDRRPLPRAAAEVLERTSVTSFEITDLDCIMRQCRDDLAIVSRATPWVRFDDSDGERIYVDHVDRVDFLHGEGRKWQEVPWVARRGYYTKEEGRKRFGKVFAEAELEYMEIPDNTDAKGEKKAPVWEIWHKAMNVCVWVSPGTEHVFDEREPYLKLEGFFPCPRPAFGTLQRMTLIPVPDFLYYKDQVEEINEITARVSALTESLKLRGFYPAGASEIGDAIETAIREQSNNQVLVPVANWAVLGGTAAKDLIVWLPVDMVAKTISDLIALRKTLIDDVYQIGGQSDIMRGDTDPNETLGAQQLKSQYGSSRIRDKQDEMVRLARDITRIAAEIMAENFSPQTFLTMAQSELRSDEMVAAEAQQVQQQLMQLQMQAQQIMASPEAQAMAAQNPEQAQQIVAQAQEQMTGLQGQLQKLMDEVTIDKVVKLLREQRLRPFVLDIETDSTIKPDEDATKQRASEFITAVGGFMGQAFPLVQQVPQAATLASEMLKYVAGQFRAGRELSGVIEEFADNMKQAASQQKPDPAMMEAQAKAETTQKELALKQAELDGKAKIEDDKLQFEAKKHSDEMALRQDELQYNRAMQADEKGRADAEASFRAITEHDRGRAESERFDRDREAAGAEAMTKAGMPPDYSFKDDRALMQSLVTELAASRDAMTKVVTEVAQQNDAVVTGLAEVAAVMAAPKRIVKDSAGRPAGIEIDKKSIN